MDIYAKNILERYKEPFYKDKTIGSTVSHKEANHSCGDVVEVDVRIDEDIITGYAFRGNGCAISMASADILGDLIDGLSASTVLEFKKEDVFEALGIEISLRRSKCALLSLLALQNGLLLQEGRESKSWTDYHL